MSGARQFYVATAEPEARLPTLLELLLALTEERPRLSAVICCRQAAWSGPVYSVVCTYLALACMAQ